MIENVSQDPWLYIIGILSGIIIIKNFWADVFIPIAKHLGIEVNSKYYKELEIFKKIYKEEMSTFNHEIKEDLHEIKLRLNDMEDLREEDRKLHRLTLDGVSAALLALQENGSNGPVTKALTKIEEYKLDKAVS